MVNAVVSEAEKEAALARRTVRRVNRRLMPFVFLLFVISYLDRVNVSYAGLQMTRELGFTDSVFGLGGGIFFIGYFLLEVPGSILAEVWSARKWIARIMITWGFVASFTGFIHSAQQFYWLRFILGIAEAGFVPGIIVYLSHWYRPRDRGKAIAIFFAAIPASGVIGAPLSALFLRIHWLGLAGWRWLLILEGLPAVIVGIITIFYLTDHPQQAKWLKDDEREWLVGELQNSEKPAQMPVWKALSNPLVLLMAVTLLLGPTATYGVSLWLPKMVQRLSILQKAGFGVSKVSLIAAIPPLCALPAMMLNGWHSDRTGERIFHAAIPRTMAGAAMAVCAFTTGNVWLSVLLLSIATIGFYSAHPGFWPLPNLLLGKTAAAASIGLINSFGNLGGFIGPYVIGYISEHYGGFEPALLFLAVCSIASGLLILFLRPATLRAQLSAPGANRIS
jgi:MFS transporter, ACS family, tartrate transporter